MTKKQRKAAAAKLSSNPVQQEFITKYLKGAIDGDDEFDYANIYAALVKTAYYISQHFEKTFEQLDKDQTFKKAMRDWKEPETIITHCKPEPNSFDSPPIGGFSNDDAYPKYEWDEPVIKHFRDM